ncbi:carbamoyl-phosphate synthase large subunit [Blastococcus sp. MG754426]|uniref:acetyl-CoA carboxylase family protein n=1 Tax=unclassified Blastococcus TaxID=2619396 RepID=UPI001EEF8619|nr:MULTISPECIES: carboxyl transferase domain-containing protein [unclassified Blastococcus]MCF6508838.1 carbamoyl-phosphate synthase large subunit [Blastococcus sp. MG754426]MCF6513526.1 carbamoyl-phosphate synthase large subunit [Blastococcus sp. MG754427]MCF6735674.1 carbamoyl-phosphate synthase large subunit [Blastococcus sp. KM273129]
MARLLIANRGEIAVRIARAAAAEGWASVAVTAADEPDAPHLAAADEAHVLPASGPAAYLDPAAIVAAALATGCTFVHPGYGFLSETPHLARACAEAGLTVVGPAAEDLAVLGDKALTRTRAAGAGVPVPRAADGDAAAVARLLDEVGAVMLKARFGGGGRATRMLRPGDDVAAALDAVQREAHVAFGNAEVLAEELVERARHVEVQLIGDGRGSVIALGDRDCSLQRNRQKVVEIAPAPALPAGVRTELAEAARTVVGTGFRGLATVEFLVPADDPGRFVFLECNPRLQVEHTVTEETLGLDLVRLQLRVAAGATLTDLGLADGAPRPVGTAVQARVVAETLTAAGAVPSAGTITALALPGGPGVRVDTAARPGAEQSPRYDPLLAKVVVHERSGSLPDAFRHLHRALGEVRVDGVPTSTAFLRALLAHPGAAGATTTFVEDHLAELVGSGAPAAEVGEVGEGLRAPVPGTVVAIEAADGATLEPGAAVVVLEAMKMEHVVALPAGGTVRRVAVRVGDTVREGQLLAEVAHADGDVAADVAAPDPDADRPDLAEVRRRHEIGLDEHRADAVAKRHAQGRRTARENLADLVDEGSFLEYGPLVFAAQERRRSREELQERTPADGVVGGLADIAGHPAVVVSYDYTVLAGTQGMRGHLKKDRLFELAEKRRLPVVLFAEGGGGRPGDVDHPVVSALDTAAFHLFGRLSGLVPTVGIASGRCFAGNAALLGTCDVVIATEDATIGMGGPAMIEGGGLGVVAPEEIGPIDVQHANGVVDVRVADDAAAVAAARQYLSYFAGPVDDWTAPDQRLLRHLVPENRKRVYDVRAVLSALADEGSVLELRDGWGAGMVTALARVEGAPLGVIANVPTHLGGAIDADAADKAARFLQLCDAHGLPVLSLCDTPGFMVGPESEKTATVRHFSRLFVIGANLSVPMGTVVLRKAYGLGAQAMAGGSTKVPRFTVGWPTSEFGPMGLEGAVRLGMRRELAAIEDDAEREAAYQAAVAAAYENGRGLNVAAHWEIDDVIDPAGTRRWIATLTREAAAAPRPAGRVRPHVDTW